jgi:lycopene beta-cyclase
MIDTEVLKTRLKTYIETNLQLSSYQIVRIERAVLPMYHINNNKTNKQPYLAFGGITGGAMRASTGYSFLSSQRWAVACANELKHKKSLSAYTPVTLIYQKMDALMLRIIRKDPSIGVTIFSRMFTKVSAERFVRFMTEKATITDFIVVIWAMPKRIFLTALLTRSKQKSPSTKITGKDRE